MELAELFQEMQTLKERLRNLEAENSLLRQKLSAALRRHYGPSSEKFSDRQLELLMAGEPAQPPMLCPVTLQTALAPASDARPAAKKRTIRRGLPKHLRTEEIILEPEVVKQAPDQWKRIGEEVTEELDYAPGYLLRRLFIRPKYVAVEKPAAPQTPAAPAAKAPSDVVSEVLAQISPAQKPVVIAPLPPRLIEKGYPGAGLMARVIIAKYEDHLPLYRQEKIYRERHGVELPRQMLAQWVEQAGFWLRPIYDVIRKGLIAGGYIQADETPIRYLDPDRPGKAQEGWLWGFSRPGSDVVFEWHTTRAKEAAQFLKDFRGHLQSDAYPVYLSYQKDRPADIKLVGCWSHCRRKFVEALPGDGRAAWFVRQIGHLYAVERKLRERRAGPRLRQAVRSAEARPVLARIGKALVIMRGKALPQSDFGEALSYALNQWATLLVYAEEGRLEIDNNLMENAIRPTAIGKKNFLFIGHPDAGWYSAVIYSLLGSCRRQGINPHEYLTDVLRRLPSATNQQIPALTPAAWAKARKKSAVKPDTS